MKIPVKILDGKIPATFETSSLFIDDHGRGGAFVGGMLLGHAITANHTQQTVVATQPTYIQAAPAPTCNCNCP